MRAIARKIQSPLIGLGIGVLLMILLYTSAMWVHNARAADYGESTPENTRYVYYIAEIDSCRIHAESWETDGDWITFNIVFKKSNCGDNTVPAVSMQADPKLVKSITKITVESKEKVQSNNCFIDTINLEIKWADIRRRLNIQ